VATEPEGLLGLAMAMIFVRGVMAARGAQMGIANRRRPEDGDYARVGCRGVDLVHGVGGDGEQEFVAGFEKCFEEHVNRFVDAVGEGELLGARP
jgi:hypothetical protein